MGARSTEPVERVAAEVRRRRRARSWTLDMAAGHLGISRRLLAQIEAGTANPSLSTLLSIAAGFDMPLVELLDEPHRPGIIVQGDNAGAPVLWRGAGGGEARLLVATDDLELWQWTLQPGDERRSDAHRPGSREVVLVTSGALTLSAGTSEPVIVRKGQSALIPADDEHTYLNGTGRPCSFIMAVHEPTGMPAGIPVGKVMRRRSR